MWITIQQLKHARKHVGVEEEEKAWKVLEWADND